MAQSFITSFFKPKPDAEDDSTTEKPNSNASPQKRKHLDTSTDEDKKITLNSKQKRIKSNGTKSKKLVTSPKEEVENKVKKENLVDQTEKSPKDSNKSEVKKEPTDENETLAEKSPEAKTNEDCSKNNKSDEVKKEVDEEESEMPEKSSPEAKSSADSSKNKPKPNMFFGGKLQEKPTDEGLNYKPAKSNYHPVNDAFWQKDAPTPYLALTRTFESIEETQGRLKMIEILSNFFWSVITLNPSDLLPCIYLSINQLAPAYEGLELGVAETTLMKIICETTGRRMDYIKTQTHTTGDLGIVAEQSRIAQRLMFQPKPLTVQGVFQKLQKIARISGKQKNSFIQEIFTACRYSEARFFIRSLMGKLRIGIAEQSLIQALAIAVLKSTCEKPWKQLAETELKKRSDETAFVLKTAFCHCPNYNKIVPTLLEYGVDELPKRCTMETGVPIKPMLAFPTRGIQEVLDRFQSLHITCEWKYDGERAQIHYNKGVVNIFSRNQEDNTQKYPDIIDRIGGFQKEGVESFIVDSEIVAWDVENKQILPFQILTTRKRKNVDVKEIKVQVCVYAFDLLYFNGQELVAKQFKERRHLLKEHFQEEEGIWQFASGIDTSDVDEVQRFLEDSIKGNCEGLMIKTLDTDATYEIAKRSRNWLKLKKDYMSNVGDSLDLVVIGGYKGKGKRTGTYGGYLLACYDNDNEEYQCICKIGTGFSDEDLQKHSESLKKHIIKEPRSYYCFDNSLAPDDWFEPVEVWEVKCADLSLSPIHKAGIGIIDNERGISLRFPRFIRIRDDKSAEDATSAKQVADMYLCQDQIKNQQNNKGTSEFEDFY